MNILVTGAVGFIGMHVSMKLVELGNNVVGIDNVNSYYTTKLKDYRLAKLIDNKNFKFHNLDLSDQASIEDVFKKYKFDNVIHLGAQAGVRYSLENPYSYINSNINGTMTILENCRNFKIKHLVYASSSSVYGMSNDVPFRETAKTDNPISLYAATKKSNELMAYSYSHLYSIPTTGLRFFTVYGPAGRPDMAPWLFTEAILNNKPIKIFNHGNMYRDFTYIDDVVEALIKINHVIPESTHEPPARIYNVGNSDSIKLSRFIKAIEIACDKDAIKEYCDIQPGDVINTFSDSSELQSVINCKPQTSIEDGMKLFVDWYINQWNKVI
jgi:UDP-glucuronate 4-epimerase